MKVEIKTERVLEEIYALSALRGYVSLPEQERALLQPDQREGLMVLVDDAFAEVVLELMPRVVDFRLAGDGDTMWIEIKGDAETQAGDAIGEAIVRITAYMALGAIYEATAEGAQYVRRAARGLGLVREVIDSTGCVPRLRGYR